MSKLILEQAMNLHQGGNLDKACSLYKRCLEQEPENALAVRQLGLIAWQTNHHTEAVELFRRAVALQPDNQQWYCDLGTACRSANRHEEALESYRVALQKGPATVRIHFALSQVQIDLGDLTGAIDNLHTCLELDPVFVSAWYTLVMLYRGDEYKFDGDEVIRLQKLVTDSAGIPEERKVVLFFTWADYLDKNCEYAQAWKYYRRANDIKHACTGKYKKFDLQAHRRLVESCINTFSTGEAGTPDYPRVNTDRQLFITGMPRSGTTLLEQMLCAHSKIHSHGELNHISRLVLEELPGRCSGMTYPGFATTVSERDLQACNRLYKSWLPGVADTVCREIDKMPGNFLYSGLLFRVFPGCRLVYMRRNPVAVCFSAYTQNLKDSWTNDFTDIAGYYSLCERLNRHWVSLFNERLLCLDYEDLVSDPNSRVSAVLDYLGLEWEEGIATYYDRQDMIRTASKLQARKPVYREANERWQNYQPWIDSLVQLLAA